MKLRYIALFLFFATTMTPLGAQDIDSTFAERFGRLALDCVAQEYPNKIAHVLAGDEDALPPRELTPAFFGCYDWHSAVHGHWLLARLARTWPESTLAPEARAALAVSLTPEKIAGEVRYLEGPGRVSFERPYGLAWLLQLAAELREWNHPQAREWAIAIEPLEQLAAARLREWIPKLTHPIRIGEHAQTAFAFGLIYDWALHTNDRETLSVVREASKRFYLGDRGCPLAYEPSGHDFLSPCLAEADLVRRLLTPTEFAAWLGSFLPTIPLDDDAPLWLSPAVVSDPGDPKLSHLDGLNLSRAWMIEGIVSALPTLDPRIQPLLDTARAHREAGLAAVTGEHYEGGHWLGSFAMYLVSARGGSRVIISGPFDVIYRGVDRGTVEDVVLPRAHKALADVTGYLGLSFDERITIDLSSRHRVPNQRGNTINLPAGTLYNDPDGYGISMVHEITHVVAASAYRPDRFYDDGLAVYLQARFGMASSYPNFERDLHQETVAIAAENGWYLSLGKAENIRRFTKSRVQRKLAYLQEGSFTKFLIERDGLEKYMKVYLGESLEDVYGKDLATLETEWRELLEAL
ncbi:MAG: DUF2891 domain-containing protein [Acidobacteriota bacterium]